MIVDVANNILQTVVSLFFFSLWAGFALLVVNPNFHADLPGYTIGRICIWEGVALIISIIIARLFYKRWGGITVNQSKKNISLSINYGYLFLCFFTIAIVVAIWQFWLFSQNF